MISNSDLQRWQQAINGITAAQSDLSSDELSAFQTLVSLINDGNFEASESGGYIQTLKNSLQQHSKNRLLKVYLTNFVALSDKYFKVQAKVVAPPAPVIHQPQAPTIVPPVLTPPTFQPPVFQPPVEETAAPEAKVETPVTPPPIIPPIIQPPVEVKVSPVTPTPPSLDETKEGKSSKKSILIIAASVLLIIGWWTYNNWESDSVLKVLNMLGLAPADTTKVVPIDTIKQIKEQTSALDTVPKIDSIAQMTIEDTIKTTVEATAPQEEQRNPAPAQLPMVKTYSFGKYSGSLKSGIPEGEGTMYYTRHTRIAKHARDPYYAEDGDVFVGTWGNGDIVNGKLFDKNNNLKATILAGKRPNGYNIGND